jgi:hypothetical protein
MEINASKGVDGNERIQEGVAAVLELLCARSVEPHEPLRDAYHFIFRGHHREAERLEDRQVQRVESAKGCPTIVAMSLLRTKQSQFAFIPTTMHVASSRCAVSGVGACPVARTYRARSATLPTSMPNRP